MPEEENWQPDTSMDYMLKDKQFMQWWQGIVKRRNAMGMPLADDPRDPDYDVYALYKTGWNPPANWDSKDLGVGRGHFPSDNPVTGKALKSDTNPRAIVDGIDTRTNKVVAPDSYTGPLTDQIKAQAGKYKDQKAVHKAGDGWNDAPPKDDNKKVSMAGMMPGAQQGQPPQQQPGQPGQQGQQGQPGMQPPPAQFAPEQLLAFLSALHGHQQNGQPQPAPQTGTDAAQQSLHPMLQGLLQMFSANPQQMQQQQQAQHQQQQPQNPGANLMQFLSQLGLGIK